MEGSCFVSLAQDIGIIMIGKQVVNNIHELVVP